MREHGSKGVSEEARNGYVSHQITASSIYKALRAVFKEMFWCFCFAIACEKKRRPMRRAFH